MYTVRQTRKRFIYLLKIIRLKHGLFNLTEIVMSRVRTLLYTVQKEVISKHLKIGIRTFLVQKNDIVIKRPFGQGPK